jgi:hypothetical protein
MRYGYYFEIQKKSPKRSLAEVLARESSGRSFSCSCVCVCVCVREREKRYEVSKIRRKKRDSGGEIRIKREESA